MLLLPWQASVGASVRIEAAAAELWSNRVCAGAAREPTSEFWLHGSEGTLHLDLDGGQLRLALKSEGGHMGAVDVPHEQRGFWRAEQEFVNAIR